MGSKYYATCCPHCSHISGRIWKNDYPSPFRPYTDRKNRGARIKCYKCEKRFSPRDGYIEGTLTDHVGSVMRYVGEASAGKATGWHRGDKL
ncbi:MAG: hypothetical protein ACYS8I_12765 [Planctomycetota bacterium]